MTDVKTEDVQVETSEGTVKTDDIEVKKVLPSMFTDVGDRISIKADLVYIKETGEIHTVVETGSVELEKLNTLALKSLEFVFTIPNYDEILTYRSRCSVANGTSGQMIVDPNKLRYFFILKHLKSWNLENENGDIIELEVDSDSDTLTEKTVKIVNSVNPKILDGIFILLENKISI